jgi:WD40 repeat protein
VRRLAFGPRDDFLAAVAEPSTVHVWSVTGRPRGRISAATRIGAFALSASGERLATAHADGTVRVTDTAAAAPVLTVEAGPHEAVDGGVEIRDIASGTTTHRFASAEPASDLTFSAGGERLAVVTRDRRVRVFDLATGESGPERQLGDVYVAAVDPAGRYLAVRGYLFGRLVDLEHEDRELAIPKTNSVVLDERGRFAAFLSEDGRVEVRALPSEAVVAELPHDAVGAAFSPDGTHVATAGRDGALRVWELDTGAEVARMDHPDKVFSPRFSADGRYLAAESSDGWA